MKHLLWLIVALFVCTLPTVTHAQVGIGTDAPNSKAVLELKSPNNNQGFLVPRLTTAQRTAITLTADDKGMLVFDSSVDKFYYWSGTIWIVIEDSVGSGTVTNVNTGAGLTGGPISVAGTISLADNGVTTIKLADGSVTTGKIADGTITTTDLANGSVTAAKLANTTVVANTYGTATQVPQLTVDAQGRITGVTNVTITGIAPAGAAGGDLTGTYPNPTVANNAITSAKIADGTIATVDLADVGVTTVKLANNAVTSAKIVDGTIVTADLADASITTLKLNDGAVTDAKITSVAPGKLTAGTATTGQVLKWSGTAWTPQADNAGTGTLTSIIAGAGLTGATITTTGTIALADAGVTTVKLADNAVTSAKIIDATIVTADLADGSVTDAKITSVAPGKLTAGAATPGQVLKWSGTAWTPQADNTGTGTVTSIIAGTGLSGGTITTTGTLAIAANGVTATELRSDATTDANRAVTTNHIRDNAITSAKILDATIATADLANNAVTSAKLADLSVTDTKVSTVAPAKLTQSGATTGQVLKWNGTIWAPATENTSGFTLPYSGGDATADPLFSLSNKGTGAVGTFISDNAAATTAAVYAVSRTNTNVAPAVYGINLNESTGYGVRGDARTAGVYGTSTGIGVYGTSTNGYGVAGATTGGLAGVIGLNTNTEIDLTYGVVGTAASAEGRGVYGNYSGAANGAGIYGNLAEGSKGFAGYFNGRVQVAGNLSKGGGSFKIDHPLDPTNKYLYHSFVESPDMKNIYDGVVVLDGSGQAEIELPDWFSALNKDFRYQLTCIGAHAPVYVSKEVQGNRFSIAGGTPGMKISWQLTGIRKDPYAEKNRIPVEEDKAPEERGKYLYPEAYNRPAAKRAPGIEGLPKID